ncbi:MAG: hypothetical protein ACOYMH_10250 [Zwartia sp.]
MNICRILLLSGLITLPTSGAWSQSKDVTPSANPTAAAPAAPAASAPVAPAAAAPVAPVAAPAAAAPVAAAATATAKSTSKTIKTSEGTFTAMRGAKGIHWNYTPTDSIYGVILKETENTEKSIVLEGYGLKFTIDPVALRLILTHGTTRKAVNINEASNAISADNVIEITYSTGKFSFIEDVNGFQDVWELTLKDGTKYQLMDQGGLMLYDPIRKILIGLDIDKKLITFDVESKKPSTQKMTDLRAAQ